MSNKARVFISCGQRKDANYLKRISINNVKLTTPELTIANQIAKELENLGFEPYVALEQQTLQGVKEGIFKRLENVEYFLFVDFRRERLYDEGDSNILSQEYRGSLFSNQELAIATFQGREVLAFQEEGVKKEDGILKFIQANCKTFSDRESLPKLVVTEVQKSWNLNWRNELSLNRSVSDYEDTMSTAGNGRFYHIRVINNHKDKIARNCFAYIERIKNIHTGKTWALELVELKWKGVKKETVSIVPKSFRYLDAFHIFFSRPTVAYLGLNPSIIDWSGCHNAYQIVGAGDYEVDYVVFSETFSPVRTKFGLHIGRQIQNVQFQKMA